MRVCILSLSSCCGCPHTAEDALRTLDPGTFRKWAAYLKMKATFYEAHVSQPHSIHVLYMYYTHMNVDKRGDLLSVIHVVHFLPTGKTFRPQKGLLQLHKSTKQNKFMFLKKALLGPKRFAFW